MAVRNALFDVSPTNERQHQPSSLSVRTERWTATFHQPPDRWGDAWVVRLADAETLEDANAVMLDAFAEKTACNTYLTGHGPSPFDVPGLDVGLLYDYMGHGPEARPLN